MKKNKRMFQVNGVDWILPSNAAVAVDRFNPRGPKGYKANNLGYNEAPLRSTRAEAERDYIEHFAKSEAK